MNQSLRNVAEVAAAEPSPRVRLRGIKKSFNGNIVLDGIDLDLRGGEIAGLMGPNGAGKSTLLKILDGYHGADRGQIEVDGVSAGSLGGRADVAFIHQDLGLIDDLSVADNLRLGQPRRSRWGVLLDRATERELAVAALGRVALDVDPSVLVGELSPGEKTLVAIARSLALGADKLFVDEATSNLSRSDSLLVLEVLRGLASDGALVVVVTHKLSEVFEFAQRVVVLMDGAIVADESMAELDRQELVSLLLDHEEQAAAAVAAMSRIEPGETVLTFTAARTPRAGPIDLHVRRGEVVGLTGTAGSGLHDVALVASGHLKASSGAVTMPARTRVALVPPQRETQGGFPALPVSQNIAISSLRRRSSLGGLISPSKERTAVDRLAAELSVVPRSTSAPFGILSGGNKQKVILARALLTEPDLLVLCEPTRGVDIKTRREIYRTIADVASRGTAVLLVSSDFEDLAAVCDRVGAVTSDGAAEPQNKSDVPRDHFEEYL